MGGPIVMNIYITSPLVDGPITLSIYNLQYQQMGPSHLMNSGGNPGVSAANPYPTPRKPLPLLRGKGFGGSSKGIETFGGMYTSLYNSCI